MQGVSPLERALYFLRRKRKMADKIAWDAGAEVTAEDVMASLKPLFDEYLLGTCEQQGDTLLYTLPDGRTFRLKEERMM